MHHCGGKGGVLKRRWEDVLSHLSGQETRSLSENRDSQPKQGQGAIPLGDPGCRGNLEQLQGPHNSLGVPRINSQDVWYYILQLLPIYVYDNISQI